MEVEQAKLERRSVESRQCHTCGQAGHLARECPRKGRTAWEETLKQERANQGRVSGRCPVLQLPPYGPCGCQVPR